MGAGGQNKGAGGTPMPGQGKGAGGQAQAQMTPQQRMASMPNGAPQQGVDDQRLRMQEMDQVRQAMARGDPNAAKFMAMRNGMGGGIASMQNKMQQANLMKGQGNMFGMQGQDFMPGGDKSGALELDPNAPAPAPAAPITPGADPVTGAAGTPQMGADAQRRMQSSMMAERQRMPGMGAMPNGTPGMGGQRIGQYMQQGFNRGGKGGGGNAKGGGGNPMAQGPMAQPMSQQGRMDQAYGDFQKQMDFRTNAMAALGGRGNYANGGIVGLAGGGRLGAVTGGGVTYGPPSAAPPPMAVATPPVAAAPAAPVVAAAPAWTPQAVTNNGGGMFGGIAAVPIVQPKAWSGPTTQQKLWEPPAKAVADGPAGLSNIDMNRALLFGAGDTSKMTDRQYATYLNMRSMTRGGQSGGGGGRSHGDRGGYSR